MNSNKLSRLVTKPSVPETPLLPGRSLLRPNSTLLPKGELKLRVLWMVPPVKETPSKRRPDLLSLPRFRPRLTRKQMLREKLTTRKGLKRTSLLPIKLQIAPDVSSKT